MKNRIEVRIALLPLLCLASPAWQSTAWAEPKPGYALVFEEGGITCNPKNNKVTYKYRIVDARAGWFKSVKSEETTEVVSADTIAKQGQTPAQACQAAAESAQGKVPEQVNYLIGNPRLPKVAAAFNALMAGKKPGSVLGKSERYYPKRTIREIDCNLPGGAGIIQFTKKDGQLEYGADVETLDIPAGYGCERMLTKLQPGSLADLREEDGHFAAYNFRQGPVDEAAISARKDAEKKVAADMANVLVQDGESDPMARRPGANLDEQIRDQKAKANGALVPDGVNREGFRN